MVIYIKTLIFEKLALEFFYFLVVQLIMLHQSLMNISFLTLKIKKGLIADVKKEHKQKTMHENFSSFLIKQMEEALEAGEQIILFQEADLIIGNHGSGLSHLIWSKPGTKMFEIFVSIDNRAIIFKYLCK